jgi:hypothetical protein
MAKEKQTPEKTAAKKATAKKSSAKKAVAKKPASENGSKAAVQAKPAPEELFEEISIRAYEIYRERGARHGAHQEDWSRAEDEIKAKYNL